MGVDNHWQWTGGRMTLKFHNSTASRHTHPPAPSRDTATISFHIWCGICKHARRFGQTALAFRHVTPLDTVLQVMNGGRIRRRHQPCPTSVHQRIPRCEQLFLRHFDKLITKTYHSTIFQFNIALNNSCDRTLPSTVLLMT